MTPQALFLVFQPEKYKLLTEDSNFEHPSRSRALCTSGRLVVSRSKTSGTCLRVPIIRILVLGGLLGSPSRDLRTATKFLQVTGLPG